MANQGSFGLPAASPDALPSQEVQSKLQIQREHQQLHLDRDWVSEAAESSRHAAFVTMAIIKYSSSTAAMRVQLLEYAQQRLRLPAVTVVSGNLEETRIVAEGGAVWLEATAAAVAEPEKGVAPTIVRKCMPRFVGGCIPVHSKTQRQADIWEMYIMSRKSLPAPKHRSANADREPIAPKMPQKCKMATSRCQLTLLMYLLLNAVLQTVCEMQVKPVLDEPCKVWDIRHSSSCIIRPKVYVRPSDLCAWVTTVCCDPLLITQTRETPMRPSTVSWWYTATPQDGTSHCVTSIRAVQCLDMSALEVVDGSLLSAGLLHPLYHCMDWTLLQHDLAARAADLGQHRSCILPTWEVGHDHAVKSCLTLQGLDFIPQHERLCVDVSIPEKSCFCTSCHCETCSQNVPFGTEAPKRNEVVGCSPCTSHDIISGSKPTAGNSSLAPSRTLCSNPLLGCVSCNGCGLQGMLLGGMLQPGDTCTQSHLPVEYGSPSRTMFHAKKSVSGQQGLFRHDNLCFANVKFLRQQCCGPLRACTPDGQVCIDAERDLACMSFVASQVLPSSRARLVQLYGPLWARFAVHERGAGTSISGSEIAATAVLDKCIGWLRLPKYVSPCTPNKTMPGFFNVCHSPVLRTICVLFKDKTVLGHPAHFAWIPDVDESKAGKLFSNLLLLLQHKGYLVGNEYKSLVHADPDGVHVDGSDACHIASRTGPVLVCISGLLVHMFWALSLLFTHVDCLMVCWYVSCVFVLVAIICVSILGVGFRPSFRILNAHVCGVAPQ